ncbi:MAG: hypothetical protein GY810_17325 [Aureispira sp.]|nr:hypothetical protein [Aureispira sp.]
MKPISTNLFDLIRSLGQHEKAYFKRHATLHSRDGGNYIKLFEAINKQKDYDETLLRKQLVNEKLIGYLPRAKKYLYQKILESLRHYYDHTTEMQLHNALSDLDLLLKKSLYSQHHKLLKKSIKLAEESENWLYYMLLWKHKIRVAARQSYTTLTPHDFDEEQESVNTILALETEKVQNLLLQTEVRKFTLMEGENIKKAAPEGLEHIKQALEEATTNTKESEIYILFAKANHDLKDVKVSTQWYKQFIETIEQYPHILSRNIYLYITAIEHWISIGGRLMDHSLIEEVERLPKILKTHKNYLGNNDTIKINSAYYYLQLKYQYDFCLYEENKYDALIQDMVRKLKGAWNSIPPQRTMLTALYCALLYFAHKKYDKAIEWIDRVIETEANALRHDLISQAYVFRCIFYFEQEDYKYLNHLLQQCTRRLKKYKHYHGYSVYLIKAMQKLMKAPNHKHWVNLKREIEDYAKQDVTQSHAYPPAVIYAWVLSRIRPCSYKTAHKEIIEDRIQYFKSKS